MFRIILILIVFFSLSGCVTPMRLGIPEAEWQTYSPEQKKKIKSGYFQILKTKFDDEKATPDGSRLRVRVSGGDVFMPPFSKPNGYTPFEFEISNGGSQTITIKDQRNDKSIVMRAYYRGKTLYLDPSRYDPDKRIGSIQLHYSPIWDRGFTYQDVSSTGYVHLSHVNVGVRRFPNGEQSDQGN